MQNTAQGYLIYELTGSALYLGLVSFAAGVPTWLFTLYGGLIADRIPRRKLLQITQSSAMLLAFILAVLVLTGHGPTLDDPDPGLPAGNGECF